jgi:hypothetical protein
MFICIYWLTNPKSDDEEFERALQKMMRESYEQRRQDAKPVNVHTELLKPLDLLGTKKDNVVKEIGQGEKAMEFRVMLKRGKERQVLLLTRRR